MGLAGLGIGLGLAGLGFRFGSEEAGRISFPVTGAEVGDDVGAWVALVVGLHGVRAGAVTAFVGLVGTVAALDVKGAVGILALAFGVGVGETGGEGGGGFLVADGGEAVVFGADAFLIATDEGAGVLFLLRHFGFGKPAVRGVVGGAGGLGDA